MAWSALRLAVSPLAQAGAWGLPELTAPGFWESWAIMIRGVQMTGGGEERRGVRESRGVSTLQPEFCLPLPATRKALFGSLWVFL